MKAPALLSRSAERVEAIPLVRGGLRRAKRVGAITCGLPQAREETPHVGNEGKHGSLTHAMAPVRESARAGIGRGASLPGR
jgi:hypothetical protein